MSVRTSIHRNRRAAHDAPARARERYDTHHPSVRAAAARAGLDVATYLLLRETELRWPHPDSG
ncbi:hypothetical protein M6D93_09665 [Jatrophihabitans telluris]|uniref:Uncharacterized protein n=1 Tax=Jatrophihabitans telluris TaxID=2038343 RepID=A0ABY4R4I3_9ACTN|nr:hypothetical protein [Jatrophihabitans telluris]UQX90247.1 hypothetical protein M6D93_09665 [Jatrophihabitans telluris]